jgi:hypothetical protein
LTSLIAPVSLSSHHKLTESDKKIWDAAYSEEFDGLSDLPTWEILTEAQFKQHSKGHKALPSMAIATIKYDAFNRPKRAKYRIVVLGNHDYHTWSKAATAAPVMSQVELQLLTALAISKNRAHRLLFSLLFLRMNIILFALLKDVHGPVLVLIGVFYAVFMASVVLPNCGLIAYHLTYDPWVFVSWLHLLAFLLVI